MSSTSQSTDRPPDYPPNRQPITIDIISELWFLILAGIFVVGYFVRLELGVKGNRERIDMLNQCELPKMQSEHEGIEARIERRIEALHHELSKEIQVGMESQHIRLSAQLDLILEKLNSRDGVIAGIKDQLNRQGNDIRELGGFGKYMIRQINEKKLEEEFD
jgi:hypothetical protein